LVGNDYGNEVFIGKYDAFVGEVLFGDGHGTFEALNASSSGFQVRGDAKALVKLSGLGSMHYIASQNRGPLLAFTAQSSRVLFVPEPDDSWAEVSLAGSGKMRIEFHYGSGYLSQSTRAVLIPDNAESITVYDWKGNQRLVKLPAAL
jgi:hypothetical protein